jgi:hypothetical protein
MEQSQAGKIAGMPSDRQHSMMLFCTLAGK